MTPGFTSYWFTTPDPFGSRCHAPTRSNTSFHFPAGGGPGPDLIKSEAVTVRVQVPASSAGGFGAGRTRATTVSVALRPLLLVTRAVKRCFPGFSQVVIKNPWLRPLSSDP